MPKQTEPSLSQSAVTKSEKIKKKRDRTSSMLTSPKNRKLHKSAETVNNTSPILMLHKSAESIPIVNDDQVNEFDITGRDLKCESLEELNFPFDFGNIADLDKETGSIKPTTDFDDMWSVPVRDNKKTVSSIWDTPARESTDTKPALDFFKQLGLLDQLPSQNNSSSLMLESLTGSDFDSDSVPPSPDNPYWIHDGIFNSSEGKPKNEEDDSQQQETELGWLTITGRGATGL